MSKREIGVKVIIEGAQPDEAFFIQYVIADALTVVQESLNAVISEREVNK